MKIFLLILLFFFSLSAKDIDYCFESSKLFLDEENVKLILPISDWNLSSEHKSPAKLFYVLNNGNTYKDEELWCYFDEKKQLYHCDTDDTDSGWLEFDIKKQRINIEGLCTYDCGVQITPILVLEDGSVVSDDRTVKTTSYIDEIFHPLGGGGDLNTMYALEEMNDERKKVWVQGYKCKWNVEEPKVVFYTIHEYVNTFPKIEEQDKLFLNFNQNIKGINTITLTLSQSYRSIASMMHSEGFSSSWINIDDIKLFIYSNNRALIKIKSFVMSSNKESCLSDGYYLIELQNDKILLKSLQENFSE